ncbi:MAG: Bro-N domain-containing protein [Oscillibacter sp.]|nr:Bro-N domain-containing protein [Oscillibacter sp.]
MTDFQVFQSEQFGKIRTACIDGVPWFIGKDVAEALGYAKSENALARHVADKDKNATPIQGENRGNPNMVIINESGLYSLILSSKLPAAKEFKRWVTSEVLPVIRKTGEYSLIPVTLPSEVEQRGLTTDDYLRAAAIVSACKNDRLPYVLGFLEQGGFSILQLKSSVSEVRRKSSQNTAKHSPKARFGFLSGQ